LIVRLFVFITLIFPRVFALFLGQRSAPRPSIWKVLRVHWAPMQGCTSRCPGHAGSAARTSSRTPGAQFC